jgi:hypothetical protein
MAAPRPRRQQSRFSGWLTDRRRMAQISGYFKAEASRRSRTARRSRRSRRNRRATPFRGISMLPASRRSEQPAVAKGRPCRLPRRLLASKAAGQKPGTSATTTASDQGPVGPPLDATAVNNIATNQFRVNNEINAATRASGICAPACRRHWDSWRTSSHATSSQQSRPRTVPDRLYSHGV